LAAAQGMVHFPSLEDNGPGQSATTLDGYLFRPPGEGQRPAIVGLHGCSGMFSRSNGLIAQTYRQWADELTRRGYVFLLVDSFGPRRHGEMCSVAGFELRPLPAAPEGRLLRAVVLAGAALCPRRPGWRHRLVAGRRDRAELDRDAKPRPAGAAAAGRFPRRGRLLPRRLQ